MGAFGDRGHWEAQSVSLGVSAGRTYHEATHGRREITDQSGPRQIASANSIKSTAFVDLLTRRIARTLDASSRALSPTLHVRLSQFPGEPYVSRFLAQAE
jgi:hypothetical protein